jgi:hypothetical protein
VQPVARTAAEITDRVTNRFILNNTFRHQKETNRKTQSKIQWTQKLITNHKNP